MVHSCFSPCNKLLYCWQHEGLNPTDFQQLENLSALFQNAPADLTKAQQFLDKLEGNKKLNHSLEKILKILEKNPQKFPSLEKEAISTAWKYSYKTKALSQAEALIQKIGQKKLTLPEIKFLEDLIKIKPQLAVLNKKGCNRERVNQIVQKTEAFLNTMHAEVAKAKPSHAVTLVAYDPKRFLSIYRTSSWISRIVNAILSVLFGTNIHHVAIGILNKDKTRFMEGHLFRTNMQDPNARYYNLQNPMPLSHWGFQQIQLDPSYLIKTDEDRMAYKKVYGDQWRQVIREKFHTQLLSKLENEQTLSHLHNPWIRRIIAAFSFKRTICPKSWEKKTPLSPGGSTICSEFTVKTILKAIHDINIVIKRDAENKGLTNLPQLNPEIDRHLRLEKLLPHEVCKLFLKSGLGVQIETPQVIQQYIEIPEVKIQYGGKV